MKPKVKSNKWYGWFWPPERRKVKILQAILDYKMPEIQPLVEKAWRDKIIYGFTEQEAEKWIKENDAARRN